MLTRQLREALRDGDAGFWDIACVGGIERCAGARPTNNGLRRCNHGNSSRKLFTTCPYRWGHNVGTWQEGEVSPSAAPPHFRTSCRALLHRAAEPFCAALL